MFENGLSTFKSRGFFGVPHSGTERFPVSWKHIDDLIDSDFDKIEDYFLSIKNGTIKPIIDLVRNKSFDNSKGIDATLEFDKCDITEETTWCIRVDTSDGEYESVLISIKYINEELGKINK